MLHRLVVLVIVLFYIYFWDILSLTILLLKIILVMGFAFLVPVVLLGSAVYITEIVWKYWNYLKWYFAESSHRQAVRAHVVFDNGETQRVGGTSKFRIKVLGNVPGIDAQKEILERLNIEIIPTEMAMGLPDGRIQFVKEFEESEVDCTVSLVVNFSVRKSGDYQFSVLDGLRHTRGSPAKRFFLPGDLDVETTSFQKPSPCVRLTSSEFSDFYVRPRDKFENICSVAESDLAKFDFTIRQGAEGSIDYSSLYEYRFTPSGGVGNSIRFKLLFKKVGLYEANISYNNNTIRDGTFDLVVMSKEEVKELDKMLKEDTNWIYHEGRLIGNGSQIENGKGRKIYIYVGSKQLSVREYMWHIIPLRVATFRVTPLTKISIIGTDISSATNTISISDGFQKVTVKMDSAIARRVVAMFFHFIKQRIGGSDMSFTAKRDFFYAKLRELQTGFRLSFSVLVIRREDVINSTIEQTRYFTGNDWYKNFRIEYRGEPGVDGGGLRREWLEILCTKCFEPSPLGLFNCLGNSRLVHPNPISRDQRHTKWSLKHYELAGKIVGKCLFESATGSSYKQMVNARFSRSFLAQVVGLRPNYRHFEQDEPELYVNKIKYILENDVEPMELTFTEDEYSSNGLLVETVELIPNGSKLKVTEENKEDYLQELAIYKLRTRVKKEVEAFAKGLRQLVPDELLLNFDENELEMLWCGRSRFDVDDLKTNFLRGNWSFDPAYVKVLEWFWACVTGFSDEEKARLLQFTTGSSLLPHGGFRDINPKFQISLSREYGKLPIAHTCQNEICLSDNLTFEKFKKCLITAINEGNQGFAFR